MRRQHGVVDKPTSLPISATAHVQSVLEDFKYFKIHGIEHGIASPFSSEVIPT